MNKLLITIFILASSIFYCQAQTITWDEFADLYLQDMEEGGGEGMSLYEELLEMHRNPLDINKAQRSDLLKMPFLNEAQVDSILSLIKQSNGLMSMGELQFVKNLEHKQRSFMPLFFYCPDDYDFKAAKARRDSLYNKDKDKKNAHYSTSRYSEKKGILTDISTTLGIPLYKREGFKKQPEEVLAKNPNKQYLGDNLSTTLRYRASLNNTLFWGLTAQKDEGEPFAKDKNFLYDSYSFYLMGRGRGVVREWVVGDYTAHFGMGLTIGSSTPDALNILSSYRPHQQGFTKHTATDEAYFLRGGAISLKFDKLSVNAFASWRQLDATLMKDSISTIITDGYHRTQLEMSKRNDIQALQAGLSLNYEFSGFTLGLNAVQTHYDTPYRTPTALYRKYYFKDKDFGNYSISYSYRNKAFALWGETATSLQGGIATQHRLQYTPKGSLSLFALHRYYTTHYLSTSAQSYKVGSRIQNEHGIMIGANIKPHPLWLIKTYFDYAHYPFAVYQTIHPSNAITGLLQAEYTPTNNTSFLLRYKYRQRPQDNKLDTLDYKYQHTFKLQARYTLGIVSLTSTADLTLLSQPDKDNTSGWMLSQKATIKPSKSTRINAALALFHTDSYSEALRLYEPILLYSSGYPTCYYHGQRISLSLQQQIGILSLAIKYSLTHYTNRDSIGSALRLYNGSTLQDILIQAAIKF